MADVRWACGLGFRASEPFNRMNDEKDQLPARATAIGSTHPSDQGSASIWLPLRMALCATLVIGAIAAWYADTSAAGLANLALLTIVGAIVAGEIILACIRLSVGLSRLHARRIQAHPPDCPLPRANAQEAILQARARGAAKVKVARDA